MPSDGSRPTSREATDSRTIAALLDPFTGFAVWAAHFLIIYCANALACARGISNEDATVQNGFRAALVLITLAAAALVVAHGWRAWRRRAESNPFLAELTIGSDAVATVGILLQLFPLALLHLCR